MKPRAQILKAKWKTYNEKYHQGKPTYRNFGRFSLEKYLEFCFGEYRDLMLSAGEKPLSYSAWLREEIIPLGD